MTTDNGNGLASGEKAQQSVIDRPDPPNAKSPVVSYDPGQTIWFVGQFADDVPAFFTRGKTRDIFLRNFITQENIFASALHIMCSRNAGFSWKLDGPPRTASRIQEILDTANEGEGWHDLIIKTSIDLYTQDDGAFWEVVRQEDREDSPVVDINHLDAQRCYHTGAPEAPVIYLDRFGRPHLLKRHNVVTFAEMPVSLEGFYGRQYSAITRLLRSMQKIRSISIRDYEKTTGRYTRAINLVKGVTSQQLKDAMADANQLADNAGLARYMGPVNVGTLDPKADVGHDTIDMAPGPEGYDEEVTFKHYINQIAMAFSSDYQEFAPLPGGGLGTGAQSEMLHLKSRGKGPGLFMKLIAHAMNFKVLPSGGSVSFFWDEQDVEADKAIAEVQAIRANTRSVRISSGEITPQVARQLANDEGDLPQYLINLMGEQDLTTDIIVDDETQASRETAIQNPGEPAPNTVRDAPIRAPASVPLSNPPNPQGPKRR